MLAWTVTNPANSPKQTYLAIAMLLQGAREVAIALNYGVILAGTAGDEMRRMHIASGFSETDREMTHMLMHLPDIEGPATLPVGVRQINVRAEAAPFHQTAMQWWNGHNWSGVSLAIVPRRGLLVSDDSGAELGCAWVYRDNSVGVAMLEWLVTNPANTPKQSLGAVLKLVAAARSLAISEGCAVLLTSVQHGALERIYERLGFTAIQRGVSHLVMVTRLKNAPRPDTVIQGNPVES
jgi:hypothetical protein